MLLEDDQDKRADQEHDGGKEESEPETDITLRVHHGDLPNDGADVDEEVEVHEDSLGGDGGINNHTLAARQLLDVHRRGLQLLDHEGRDVWLETTDTHAEEDDTDGEASEGAVGVLDDGGNRSNDHDDVADHGDCNGGLDGLETAPFGVGNIATEQGDKVSPETVDWGRWVSNLNSSRCMG